MNLDFSAEDNVFREEVRGFLKENLTPELITLLTIRWSLV